MTIHILTKHFITFNFLKTVAHYKGVPCSQQSFSPVSSVLASADKYILYSFLHIFLHLTEVAIYANQIFDGCIFYTVLYD